MALYANMERFFSVMQLQTKNIEKPFWFNHFLV